MLLRARTLLGAPGHTTIVTRSNQKQELNRIRIKSYLNLIEMQLELKQETTRNKGIATRSKKLLVALGITTGSKKLLGTRASLLGARTLLVTIKLLGANP